MSPQQSPSDAPAGTPAEPVDTRRFRIYRYKRGDDKQ
jgi:hypothetical protein